MDTNEFRTFIKAVVGVDKRTTGKEDLEDWVSAAHEDHWTLPTAMRALRIFRRECPDKWLNPGHISGIIRDARRKAAETFVLPKEPDDIRNADLPAWHRAQMTAHQDRLLADWATGEPMPVTPAVAAELTGHAAPQLTSGLNLTTCPPELKEHVAESMQRAGRDRPSQRRPAVPLPRAIADNEDRRAHARAELEAKRAEAEAKTSEFEATRSGGTR